MVTKDWEGGTSGSKEVEKRKYRDRPTLAL